MLNWLNCGQNIKAKDRGKDSGVVVGSFCYFLTLSEGLPRVTMRRSCRSSPVIGQRVITRRSRLDWARSETGNSNRKEKTARRFVLMLWSENSTNTARVL